jgi:hypothetical protein
LALARPCTFKRGWGAIPLEVEGRVLALLACMGEVSLAIAQVRHVLDWAMECHACSAGAQPLLVGLLNTPAGVHFNFIW